MKSEVLLEENDHYRIFATISDDGYLYITEFSHHLKGYAEEVSLRPEAVVALRKLLEASK